MFSLHKDGGVLPETLPRALLQAPAFGSLP